MVGGGKRDPAGKSNRIYFISATMAGGPRERQMRSEQTGRENEIKKPKVKARLAALQHDK